jgi:hypothetical protein
MTEASPPRIDSQAAFVDALRWGFETAIEQGARQLLCVDARFTHWPLDDAALLSNLSAWLRLPQRRLVLLAASYDEVPRRHPRFNTWRRDWVHAMSCWQAPEELAADLPTVLLDDRAVSVRLIDAEHWRGRAEVDARSARLWRDRVDVVLQRSATAFSVNTLGL